MAYTSEIEKLERRWLENPKGRNFAPLADAYRKAGELDRAIDLCKNGLELHPDYVSAYIVYGRCLIDKKDDPAAEEVFRKVLTLDQENILALKILGELAARTGRFDLEVDWLTRLLAADPMNGDAPELLARAKVKAANMKTAAPPPAAPAAAPVEPIQPAGLEPTTVAEAPTTAMDKPDFVLERASLEHAAPLTPPPAARTGGVLGDLETFDGSVDFNAAANAAARADGIELQEEVELKPDAVPLEGLARTQYEASGMFKTEADGAPASPPASPRPPAPAPAPAPTPTPAPPPPAPLPELEEELPDVDLPLIMPEDIGPPEPEPAAEPPAPPQRATRRPTSPPAAPAAVALSDDDGAADTAALSRAEPVVTETMAELYLRQGHREEALRVYQALLAQRPGDVRLQARVRELGGTAAAPAAARRTAPSKAARSSEESAGAYLRDVLSGRAGSGGGLTSAAPPPTAGAAAAAADGPEDSPGAALDEAFGAELEPPAPPPGAPTRPADDSISLDSVFGEARDSRPQFPPSEGGAVGSETGGFSFDEFFSAPPPAPPGPAASGQPDAGQPAKGPARPSGRQGRPPEDPDLDQFQSWLKGLKS